MNILGDKKKRNYDPELVDKVNEKYKDWPTSSPSNLEPYYERIIKKPNESYNAWNDRMQKLEAEINEWPELRMRNGEINFNVWEKAQGRFGFNVDWDEIKRKQVESKLIKKIEELREEYAGRS